MLIIHRKDRLREMLQEDKGGELAKQIAYLASYGAAEIHCDLLPDERDPYVSVVWVRGPVDNKNVWMQGAIVGRDDGSWSVHT
ncbi:MAG: hypothetical protein KJN60_11325 [Boseongicola sp.]|nr:hypothetical protein [Boseongicola sp.]